MELPLSSDDAMRIARQLVASALSDYADPGVRAAGTLAVRATRLVLSAAENAGRFGATHNSLEVESLLDQLAHAAVSLRKPAAHDFAPRGEACKETRS